MADVPGYGCALATRHCNGRIHEVVEVRYGLGTHQQQGYSGTAVEHRGRRQQGGNRHATVGGVQVRLVAVPALRQKT